MRFARARLLLAATLVALGACKSAPDSAADGVVEQAFDGPVCTDAPVGPLTFSSPDQPQLGWSLTLASAGADAGTADAGASACLTSPASGAVSCRGVARLEARTNGAVVTFGDGTQLVWNGQVDTTPPFVTSTAGDSVWADYESMPIRACGGLCGNSQQTLEIRDAAGGRVRYFGQGGPNLPPLTNDQIQGVFGVGAVAVARCSFHAQTSCVSFDRTELDHLLQTTPAQTVGRAWTSVQTGQGTYRVFWASSAESNEQLQAGPACADNPGAATDNRFVAVLLAP